MKKEGSGFEYLATALIHLSIIDAIKIVMLNSQLIHIPDGKLCTINMVIKYKITQVEILATRQFGEFGTCHHNVQLHPDKLFLK